MSAVPAAPQPRGSGGYHFWPFEQDAAAAPPAPAEPALAPSPAASAAHASAAPAAAPLPAAHWYGRFTAAHGLVPTPLYYALAPSHAFAPLPGSSAFVSVPVAWGGAPARLLTVVGCVPCAPGGRECACYFVASALAAPHGGVATLQVQPRAFPARGASGGAGRCQPRALACFPALRNGTVAVQQPQQHWGGSDSGSVNGSAPPLHTQSLPRAQLAAPLLPVLLSLLAAALLARALQWLGAGEPPDESVARPRRGSGGAGAQHRQRVHPPPPRRRRRRRSGSVSDGEEGSEVGSVGRGREWGGEGSVALGGGGGAALEHHPPAPPQRPSRPSPSAEPPAPAARQWAGARGSAALLPAGLPPLGTAFDLLVGSLVRQARALDAAQRTSSQHGVLGLHRAALAAYQA